MAKKKKKMSAPKADMPSKSGQKGSASGAPKAAKSAPMSAAKNAAKSAPKKTVRGAFCKICPYVMLLFGVVLALCLIIVHIVDSNDGVGSVGYFLQWLFGGLFG